VEAGGVRRIDIETSVLALGSSCAFGISVVHGSDVMGDSRAEYCWPGRGWGRSGSEAPLAFISAAVAAAVCPTS